MVPAGRLRGLNAKSAPFRAFRGGEVTARVEHILVIGVGDRELDRRWCTYLDLCAFCLRAR